MNITIDPEFRDLIPPLQPAELDQLHKSIVASGCRDSLIVWKEEKILVDGHNRYAFCSEHGIEMNFIERRFTSRQSVKNFIILNQLGRRNVDPDTASMLRGMLYNGAKKSTPNPAGTNQHAEVRDQNDPQPNTAETIAKQTGVSPATVKRDGKFTDALDKLGMSLQAFKESGRGKGSIIAEAFPPKPRKAKPAPAVIIFTPPTVDNKVDDLPLPEPIENQDEEDALPIAEKPPEPEIEPWTIILLQIPKITKAQRQELLEMLIRKWDCKPAQ